MAWTIEDAKETYGIKRWGNGYFSINAEGHVVVHLGSGCNSTQVSLAEIAQGLKERGREMPYILRFRDLLDQRIQTINEAFLNAIKQSNYQGKYRGVYPIKVNQQQQVIEEVCRFGRAYHHGLEAGSKPELLAALAYLNDPEALLICNGYKDEEFIELALLAQKMGFHVILVLEMPSELELVLRTAEKLGIRPRLGIRFRLSTSCGGHWEQSGGDRSVFGLNSSQVIDAVDQLKQTGYLDCLQMLHYHQGSQIPNIRHIREAATEATRVYAALVEEGAPMGFLDMGGGLAVDYDGSQSDFSASCNYSVEEYASALVEIVQQRCDAANIAHPVLVTESGRALVAYYSMLVFNILDVTRFHLPEQPQLSELPNPHELIQNLVYVAENITATKLQESYNDALYYRDTLRSAFTHGSVSLRERAMGEKYFWHISTRISSILRELEEIPEELTDLEGQLNDFYYGNFSVFQSLPDSWAIDQLFPMMPLHRLDEEPLKKATIADITCDCDGKIDRFVDVADVKKALPLHELHPDQDYLIGAFLVGAYQETLGDLHNLFGDPHVATIAVENGKVSFTAEIEGDSVADVLSYVEYNPKQLLTQFRNTAERAVEDKLITPAERKSVIEYYRNGLNGYTYFES